MCKENFALLSNKVYWTTLFLLHFIVKYFFYLWIVSFYICITDHTKYFILFLYRPSFIFHILRFIIFIPSSRRYFWWKRRTTAHRYLLDSSILSRFDFFAVLSILLAQAACPFSFYLTFSIRYTYTHTANSSVSFRRIDGGTLYGATLIPRHRHVLSPLFSFPSRVSLRSFRSRETINTSL